jgi:hypothetical protein
MQTGAMFAFNSHFNFGLLFVAFILLGIGATGLRAFSTRYARPSLHVLAVPLLFLVTKGLDPRSGFPSLATDNSPLMKEARQAARRDKQAPRKKFLLFEHHLWPLATGIAIALERNGYRFRVSREWVVMFGEDNDGSLTKELAAGKVALWRLRTPGEDGRVISTSVPAIDPAGAEISFAGGEANAAKFAPVGWDVSTGGHSWSTASRGIVYFAAVPATSDVIIKVLVFPADFSGKKPQRVGIKFNDGAIQQFDVWKEGTLEMRVPAETWNQRAHATLLFEFPDAISPAAVGFSGDHRPISCGFIRITFEPAPAADERSGGQASTTAPAALTES